MAKHKRKSLFGQRTQKVGARRRKGRKKAPVGQGREAAGSLDERLWGRSEEQQLFPPTRGAPVGQKGRKSTQVGVRKASGKRIGSSNVSTRDCGCSLVGL